MVKAKILLADDKVAVRRAIKLILERNPALVVSAEARDGIEAVEAVRDSCPDIAVLDFAMPRMNGVEAARKIVEDCPNTLVLVDSLDDAVALRPLLEASGIKGFVSKMNLTGELVPAIRTILEGGMWFPAADSTI